VPELLGVPLMIPEFGSTLRPAGRDVALYEVGLLVAVIVYERGEPTVPLTSVSLVIAGIGGGGPDTVTTQVALPVPVALVALIVTLVEPKDVAVPLMYPVF
jgi:hypothetical protein